MKITNCEIKSPFPTFSFRDKCLRRRGRGVVNCASFLISVAMTVVLSLVFALSMPSFAQERSGIRIIISTGPEDIDIENEDSINSRDKGIQAEHSGTGNIDITNEDNIRGDNIGIDAKHTNMGDIDIENEGTIERSRTGIRAIHTHEGEIDITNENLIKGGATGIYANHGGEGDIEIENEGSIKDSNKGIHAIHTDDGKIEITNESGISAVGTYGIHANHTGTGDIEIDNEKNSEVGMWSTLAGIFAEHANMGDIKIDNEDNIFAMVNGLRADHSGTGNIEIINEDNVSVWVTGIRVRHTGTGNTKIINEDDVSSYFDGIDARHTNGGILHIVAEESSEIISGDVGIDAYQEGNGVIDIDVASGASIASTGKYGIFAQHSGNYATSTDANGDTTHSVHLDIKGAVKGHKKGILVKHSGTGDIVIEIDDEGSASADWAYGVKAEHIDNGTGDIKIDLSGAISGGDDNGPIHMTSNGTKTLILRPGFELNSGQSHVDIISAGEGAGILELNQDDDGTAASESLNFGALNFQDFNRFAKRGGNTWKIYGTASDTEMFDRAVILGGTLRFMGGVTFKMSPPETGTARSNYFRIDDGAVLEVVGSNTLDGNLNNLGEIVFTRDPNVAQNPASILEVKRNYKGSGEVVFDVDSGSWRADKLKILGNNENTSQIADVEIRGTISNFISSQNEYLPMEIEVAGTSNSGSFVTGESDGYDVNHHKYLLRRYSGTDAQGNPIYRWRFHRSPERSRTSGQSSAYVNGVLIAAGSLEPLSGSGDSDDENSELGFRADTSGYAGGVWGRQRSLRTSAGPSVIASRGLRTEDNRVYFGYDMPAMNFMGGDMIVGTNVWHGFSVSDVFSSSGRSSIDVESHAAALSASWWSPGGFYAGGRTQYARFSGDISTERFIVVKDNQGISMSASAEAGYRFAVPLGRMDFGIVPQAQLVWARADFDDFVGLSGEVVSLEDGELVTGRLGLSWDGEWRNVAGSGRMYGGVNLHGAVDGKTTISISGAPLSRERSDLSADGRLGVSYEWDGGYAVRGEVSALHRDDSEEIRADIGMSLNF